MRSRVAYFGVFTALALIFSYVESLIPINFGIPGVKLGLANLVIVIALYKMKLSEVFLLDIVRVLLSGKVRSRSQDWPAPALHLESRS